MTILIELAMNRSVRDVRMRVAHDDLTRVTSIASLAFYFFQFAPPNIHQRQTCQV
jgi:hypothetical protein